MRFTAVGPDSTRVELAHSRFERHGSGAQPMHQAISEGSAHVLDQLRDYLEPA